MPIALLVLDSLSINSVRRRIMANRKRWVVSLLVMSAVNSIAAEPEDFFKPACEQRDNRRDLYDRGTVSGTNGSAAVQQQAMAACNQKSLASLYVTECSTSCSTNPFVKNKNNATVTCDWFLYRISVYRFVPSYTSEPEVLIADYNAGVIPIELSDGSLLVSEQGSLTNYSIYSRDGKKLRSMALQTPEELGGAPKMASLSARRFVMWSGKEQSKSVSFAFFNENGQQIGAVKNYADFDLKYAVDYAISADRKQIAFLMESSRSSIYDPRTASLSIVLFDENGNLRKRINLTEQFPNLLSYNAQIFFGSSGEYWITAYDGSLLVYTEPTDSFRFIPFLAPTLASAGFQDFGYAYGGIPDISGLKSQSASAALQLGAFWLHNQKRIEEKIHWIDASDRVTTLDLMNPMPQDESLGTTDKPGFYGSTYAKLDRFGKLESVTYALEQILSNIQDTPARTVTHYYRDNKIVSESAFESVWSPQASELFEAGFRAQILLQDRYFYVDKKSHTCVDAQRKPSTHCAQLSISDLSGKQQWNIVLSDVAYSPLQFNRYRLYPISKDEFSVTYLGNVRKGAMPQNGQYLKKFKLNKACDYVQLRK